MCDVCGDLLALLQSHDPRLEEKEGLQLSKAEVLAVVTYVQVWQQRQCMCCYKDYKNFERLNNLCQVVLHRAIKFIQTLPQDCLKERQSGGHPPELEQSTEQSEDKIEKVETKDDTEVKSDKEVVESKKEEDGGETKAKGAGDVVESKSEKSGSGDEKPADKKEEQGSGDSVAEQTDEKEPGADTNKEQAKAEPKLSSWELEHWTLDEKDCLFQFVTKVFLMNFPLYIAYKHCVHASLEELTQQEASALNNYCELSDPEIPVYLLRNVCFFCDSNGIQAIAQCFDAADPEILPYTVAHTLINIIANLRLWMNIPTVMQNIVPLRSHVIRYMCQLSDKDLRMAGTRNMTDLMWAAVKEPIETQVSFDKEGLDLAFKYFTCSTLTIRLAGITQINNQINLYHELANNESIVEADRLLSSSIGKQLADWLSESRIVEHIFGPNLHVEIIKQSQTILTFLSLEGRISNDHIDSVWAASQLKHCGKQVHDILIPLIRSLEVGPAQHLLTLLSLVEPTQHTEQTLLLAQSVIKFLWNSSSVQSVSAVHHHGNQQQYYTALAKEQEEMDTGEKVKADFSSSESAEGSGAEMEEGEVRQGPRTPPGHVHCSHHHHHHRPQGQGKARRGRMVKQKPPAGERSRSSSMEGHRSDGEEMSDNSSLCGNSELSNISEDSLPSDGSHPPTPRGPHTPRGAHHSNPRGQGKVQGPTRVLKKGMKKGPRPGVGGPRNHKAIGRNPPSHPQTMLPAHQVAVPPTLSSDDEEEEVEDEDLEEEEEEEEGMEEYCDSEDGEVMKHMKVVRVKHGDHFSEEEEEEEEEEDSSEYSSDEGEGGDYDSDQEHQAVARGRVNRGLLGEKGKHIQGHLSMKPAECQKAGHSCKKCSGHNLPEQLEGMSAEAIEQMRRLQAKQLQEESSEMDDTGVSDTLNTSGEVVALLMEGQSSEGEMSPTEKAYLRYNAKHGVSPEEMEAYLEHIHSQRRHQGQIHGEYIEDILSPDEGSCNSSHISTKSEKNMADFEGEDVLSDEELAHINAHAHFATGHPMQHHLANMASMYHKHMPKAVVHHRPKSEGQKEEVCSGVSYDEVCKPGSTLLWDLVQEHKLYQLPEGLAAEAEKVLCSLVCFATDRRIRTKFIEACVENVANHRSVVISLRLLPKIFGSFHQYRSGLDTHAVTMWSERELQLMRHFFNNLVYYTNAVKRGNSFPHALYSYKEEIQVRLQFLTCVFSNQGSPDHFRLSLEQVDTLWNCLATDPECSDDCFNWFLNQAKSGDHHALGLETFKHIFIEKMPQIQPEMMTMVGLNLFTQLCHLARIANASLEKPLPDERIYGMDQLWGIALRAHNTDVSLTAIHYLNNYYINFGSGILEKEEEFVQRCMDSLDSASRQLDQNPESCLLIIQRGLILLTNHLESFRKRYAFHLRNWQLDGNGIVSHQKNLQDKQSTPLQVVLQPASSSDRQVTIEMLSSDLVAELRAEVTRWWETVQKQQQAKQAELQRSADDPKASGSSGGGAQGSVLTPILGAMLGDGPIRMITLGQELTVDMDEKTLVEMQFKDMQMIFVSLGASRPPRKQDGSTPASYLPPPCRDKLPMMLLLAEAHFERLFGMLQQLSNFRHKEKSVDLQEQYSLQTKARVLSRKVWDLLMLLPTNPTMFDSYKNLATEKKAEKERKSLNWENLLDPHNPHKLMYSLQVVESLSWAPKHRRRSTFQSRADALKSTESIQSEMSIDEPELPEDLWSKQFIKHGGLKHLFSVFMSRGLQMKGGDHWNEWHQDCLAYLLRLMSQFAVIQADIEAGQEDVFDAQESPRKKQKKAKTHEKLVPRLNETILSMMDEEEVVNILMSILYDAAVPSQNYQQWPQTSWGRVEVVHYAWSFLVSVSYTCEEAHQALCTSDNFAAWLRRLALEAPEPPVRQENCQGLYRLCLGRTAGSKTGYGYVIPVLASLLMSLDVGQNMKNAKKRSHEEKEPYGPGCRDYFWLVCRLVDSVVHEDAVSSWEEEVSPIDLNALGKHVCECITSRPYHEKRLNTTEDDGLIGLLHLCTSILKHNPPFKTSTEGQAFLVDSFWSLFALPSPKERWLPKCKSMSSRSAAFDLLIELVKSAVENYSILHEKVLAQHHKDSHLPYSWDAWPHEEERSKCGYVGLTNLGATCYMATCMQHLYMIPEARKSVLEASCSYDNRHEGTLHELKRMFAYLLESERKAYNPRNFCKVYTMDHQPLNTGEQKDMTEFFTDLITKLEEMGPELKTLVKCLFGGTITNNVVSLDCPHVSRTKEEFYTVRCQVADMRNLQESLDEVTVKDMLEGDNMYTCSKCQKKVRAEKRACFKKLPNILCFNTMRYTFNMVTMMKEKVNTHFSFPLRLDMSPYMEKNLIRKDRLQADEAEFSDEDEAETAKEDEIGYEYELIGVTVHTGTADGGHYYSFIRDRMSKNPLGQEKWYLFNDAEVKPFDPAQIASECFGGEMTSKTYDSVTDKFMDFSFEKTNSAYMLFYKRIMPEDRRQEQEDLPKSESSDEEDAPKFKLELTKELAEWIWQDNMQFLQDKNIFEHTYFGFVWQMCGYIPTTLPRNDPEQRVALMATKLGTSFVLETLIHAKEKPTMLQWIELLTKQFNSCPAACEWFLDTMAEEDWWPQQILIKCPNQTVRQMFQRLVIHVISQLKPKHSRWYLHPLNESDEEEVSPTQIGNKSCVTRFIRKMLSIIHVRKHHIDHGSRPHCKYLTEYFAFLLEFAKMGDDEAHFLLHINAISTMVSFFMGHKAQENYVEIVSDDEEEEEEEDVITLSDDKYRPQSLEKMIALIAMLVEKSRGEDKQIRLDDKDYHSLVGGKGFPFLYNQIRDGINVRQTCNLIFSLCRWNDRLAMAIVQMIFGAISGLGQESQPFFKLLSLLVEFMGGPPGMPPFTHYILQKFWEVADFCPHQCLDWLSAQVSRNKIAHAWCLSNLEVWVELFLLSHSNLRVRNSAACLLVALVPSNHFRQAFRTSRNMLSPHKENIPMSQEAVGVLHDIYNHLLRLLPRAKQYVDPQTHGTTKLVPYFAVLNYCLLSRTEKLMFSRHFMDLWQLFQPKLTEPPISTHHNKQALLIFWHQVCVDCPENIKLIVSNAHVTKNIAFNYILADHEDQDVMIFNRSMLPAYYGILRMCCQASRCFTRQLAQHQNIQWAFKNITPHPGQYTAAVEELFRMMKLMVMRYPETTEEELKAINQFKRNTTQLYLQNMDARTSWQTLITALKILVETSEDKFQVLQLHGLSHLHEAFNTLHVMHHEATACHVTGEMVDLLTLVIQILKVARQMIAEKKGAEVKPHLYNWKDRMDFARKLLTLLNSYSNPDLRQSSIDALKEMVLTFQNECLQVIVPILVHAHGNFQDSNIPNMYVPVTVGPYFPKRGQKAVPHKSNIRPPRPQFQMFLHSNQLEATRGVDEPYDQALQDYYFPYHTMVDLLVRVAVNQQCVSEQVVNLSAMVAYEGVPLHAPYFAKLWYEIYQSEQVDKNCITLLCNSSFFVDYVDAMLLDERQALNAPHIYQFFCNYFPKVYQQVLNDQGQSLMDSIVASVVANHASLTSVQVERDLNKLLSRINGDLRALLLIFSVQIPKNLPPTLLESLSYIHLITQQLQAQRLTAARQERQEKEHYQRLIQSGSDGEGDHSAPKRAKRKSESDNDQKKSSESESERGRSKSESETDKDKKKAESDKEEDKGKSASESEMAKRRTRSESERGEGKSDSESDKDKKKPESETERHKRKSESDKDEDKKKPVSESERDKRKSESETEKEAAAAEDQGVPRKRRRTASDDSLVNKMETDEKTEKTSETSKTGGDPKSTAEADKKGKTAEVPKKSPAKKAKPQPEPKPGTSKDHDEPPASAEESAAPETETGDDSCKTAESEPKPGTSKGSDDQSSGEESDKSGTGLSEGARNEGGRAAGHKEKPTMLDIVVKNIEAIFKMLKKD